MADRDTCSTGKNYFASQAAARAFTARQATKNGRRRLATYRCPMCKGWHMTHAENQRRDRALAKLRRQQRLEEWDRHAERRGA